MALPSAATKFGYHPFYFVPASPLIRRAADPGTGRQREDPERPEHPGERKKELPQVRVQAGEISSHRPCHGGRRIAPCLGVYADAATLHMATGYPVACAFDSGNMPHAARAIIESCWPNATGTSESSPAPTTTIKIRESRGGGGLGGLRGPQVPIGTQRPDRLQRSGELPRRRFQRRE
uniref:Uncharacterized protein n=1 Tax=Candidatus Kentrum sp. SD TaxID=2126332 RepID=A0A450YIT6_9GAMM|nr:MAG: hypothetical protein BECKSD772F_GA0070984_109211 [Candidatus Kentron sp. SD]VFK47256.1 MAG: hypothetical protein BECKSD772E_GA0070983_109011 [Candidatus Kentron sp. SD]